MGDLCGIMQTVCSLLLLSGIFPLACAWHANRLTALRHGIVWAMLAWMAWCWLTSASSFWSPGVIRLVNYLALCLTGCAGVAVLGARRPGAGAWNFVVAGLLAILLLPIAESLVAGGELRLEGPRLIFLSATLAVIILNYLPTRLAPAALLLAAGCALEILRLAGSEAIVERLEQSHAPVCLLIALTPWAALERLWRQPAPDSEFDRVWLDFRDRWGLVWGQRVREQFNSSAVHAGWPVVLRWGGLRLVEGTPLPEPEAQAEMVNVLRALLKRFAAEAVS